MTNYNPSDPCTIGPEWFVNRYGAAVIDSDTKSVAYRLHAVTADLVEEMWTFLRYAYGGNTVIIVEVFDVTTGLPALPALTQSTYYPTSDVFVAPAPWTPGAYGAFTGYNPSLGGAAAKWQAIDSPTLTPGSWALSGAPTANDEFVFNFFGYGYDFACRVGGMAGTQSGHWVTRVRSRAICAQYLALGASGAFQIQPYLWLNGVKAYGPAQAVSAAQGPVEILHDWHYNPLTGSPWTGTDMNRFDTGYGGGQSFGVGWVVQPTGSSNNLATILQGQLIVESAVSDPRLNIGSTLLPAQWAGISGIVGWRGVLFRDPAGAVTGSDPGDPNLADPKPLHLVAGHDYVFMVRRGESYAGPSDTLSPGFLSAAPQSIKGPPFWTSYQAVQLDPISYRPISLGAVYSDAYGCVLTKAGGGISLDSQPYAGSTPISGIDAFPGIGTYYENSTVENGKVLKQRFTPTATDEYGWVWAEVAMFSDVTDADLTVEIRDVATNTLQGTGGVITSERLTTPKRSWQKVGVRMAVAPILTSGTQYYLKFVSAASHGEGWLVQVINAGYEPPPVGPPTGSSVATWGGGINPLDRYGTLEQDMTAVATLSTIPPFPAEFTAIPSTQTCCMSHVALAWDTSVGIGCGGFFAYEIQRNDDEQGWVTIFLIHDVAVLTIDDWESKRNTVASYRIRCIRADGAPSDWSPTATATAPMGSCVGLMFTSNVQPESSLFYQDTVASRKFSWPENVQEFLPQGRNLRVVYGELPDRGTLFNAQLRVRDGYGPCVTGGCDDFSTLGERVFWPLREMCRAGLPYVCVMNEAGDRWYASIRVPSGEWQQHGIERGGGWAAYQLDIVVAQVTDRPYVVDALAGGS